MYKGVVELHRRATDREFFYFLLFFRVVLLKKTKNVWIFMKEVLGLELLILCLTVKIMVAIGGPWFAHVLFHVMLSCLYCWSVLLWRVYSKMSD